MILKDRTKILAALVLAVFICLGIAPLAAECAEKPAKNDITRTEFFLKKFEEKVEKYKGQPFKLGYEENE
ncbi:MAG: hypothetical protein GX310_08050, partial [Synergistaceae bacterium]|nr:hypothetical protein [Synergistaceae bacterium]